jgi:hypothetical protein
MLIDVYKKAFDSSIGGSGIWDDTTIYLYFAVVFISFFFGYIIEKGRKNNGCLSIRTKPYFLLLGLGLSLFLGLRGETTGIDTIVYRNSFDKALEPNAFADETTEPGYQLVLKILHIILPSSDWAILFFSFLTIALLFSSLWKYRDSINLFVAISLYVCLFYFQALNLLRIFLAIAILLCGFHYIVEGKYGKYCLYVLIAATFHYSSFIMLLPLSYLYIYRRAPIIALLGSLVAVFAIVSLAAYFGDYMMIARYAEYAKSYEDTGGVGFMLFFEYLPCAFFIYYAYHNKLKGIWVDMLVSYSIIGLIVKIASYYISIAGRLTFHFLPLFIIIIPFFANHIKTHSRKYYPCVVLFLVLYALIRFHFYLKGYLATDGIMPYHTIFK